MSFKCFIFVSALQSALLCNSSQLTNLRESRGHIRIEAWVGVSPQALWLHVGWNPLFSTDYSFVKAHVFFQWDTPGRFIKRKNGATLVGLTLIWEIQLDSAHMLKNMTAVIQRTGLWLLEPCMKEYTLIFHCSAVKALLTLHLHMLCIYCKNIIQEPRLQGTEECSTLSLKRL